MLSLAVTNPHPKHHYHHLSSTLQSSIVSFQVSFMRWALKSTRSPPKSYISQKLCFFHLDFAQHHINIMQCIVQLVNCHDSRAIESLLHLRPCHISAQSHKYEVFI